MTEPTSPRTYRTRTGLVLTDADIERIAEEVATTDLDLTGAEILYPPHAPETARKAATRPPREPQRTSRPSGEPDQSPQVG